MYLLVKGVYLLFQGAYLVLLGCAFGILDVRILAEGYFGADWFSIVRQLAFLGGAQICHRKTYIFGDGPKKWKSDFLTHISCGNLVALPIVCKE